jgi:hypothetical protein
MSRCRTVNKTSTESLTTVDFENKLFRLAQILSFALQCVLEKNLRLNNMLICVLGARSISFQVL